MASERVGETVSAPEDAAAEAAYVARATGPQLLAFQIGNEPVVQQRNAFKPFDSFVELERYRMYFVSSHRRVLW